MTMQIHGGGQCCPECGSDTCCGSNKCKFHDEDEREQKMIEQARASEREKVQKEGFEKGGWVQIDSNAFLIMMEKKEAEIRASEQETCKDIFQAQEVIKAIQEKKMIAPDFLLTIVEETRADERGKSLAACSKWNSATIAEVAKIKQEAYLAGQRSKTAYELGKGDGLKAIMDTCEKCRNTQYTRGRQDLAFALTGRDAVNAACEYWYVNSELTDGDKWTEITREERNDYREMFKSIIEKAIKASESLGAKGNEVAPRVMQDGELRTSGCKVPANPKPEKPKTKRRNGYAKRL